MMVNRVAYIEQLCVGREVLDLGCTDAPSTAERLETEGGAGFLHGRITRVANRCLGVDMSQEGIDICQRHGYTNIVYGDAERLEEYLEPQVFEIVVAGEIIEHLSNPGLMLASVRPFLKPEGKLIVTAPNAFYWIQIVRAILGQEDVCNPDHVARYSARTLKLAVGRHGYQVEDVLLASNEGVRPRRLRGRLAVGAATRIMRLNPRLCPTILVTAAKPR